MQFTRNVTSTVAKRSLHLSRSSPYGVAWATGAFYQPQPNISFKQQSIYVTKRGMCAANNSNNNKQQQKQLCTVVETRVRTTDTVTGYSLFVKKCMEITSGIVFGSVIANAAAIAAVTAQPSLLPNVAWAAMFLGQISPFAAVGVLLADREMVHVNKLDKETNCSYEISYAEDSDSRKIFFAATAVGASAASFFNFMDILEMTGALMIFAAPISIFGGALAYSHVTAPDKYNVWGPAIAGNITGLTVVGAYTGLALSSGEMTLLDSNMIMQFEQFGLWSSTLFIVNTCAKYTYESKIPDHLICSLMAPLSFMVFFW